MFHDEFEISIHKLKIMIMLINIFYIRQFHLVVAHTQGAYEAVAAVDIIRLRYPRDEVAHALP